MEENIIYLLTKIEFDGEKVPKTHENEFWNKHHAKNWIVFAFFGNNQTIQKINTKKQNHGVAFYEHC